MSHYLGDYTSLCSTMYGHKILVDTRDLSLAPHLLTDGRWENWVTRQLESRVRGAEFIDIGANVGWYMLAATHFGAYRAFCFEPNPRMFSLLQRTANINGLSARCELYNDAVGSEESVQKLWSDPWYQGSGSLQGVPNMGRNVSYETRVRKLDDLFKGRDFQKVVMKIDVEGHEGHVILGATDFIQKNLPVLFVEKNSDNAQGSLRVSEAFSFLKSLGYTVAHCTHTGHLEPTSYENIEAVLDAETLLFTPRKD